MKGCSFQVDNRVKTLLINESPSPMAEAGLSVKELCMSDKAAASGKERKPRQMPSSFTILFGCLLLVAIASWVVSSFSP